MPRFDEQVAWEQGTKLRTMAIERGLAVVMDFRRFNQPLLDTVLEGTTSDNPEWVRRKSTIAVRYHRSSYSMGLSLKQRGQTLDEPGQPVADFATQSGSFPLQVEGAGIAGCVPSWGLPQFADHDLAVEAPCAMLGRDYDSLKLGPEEN